MSREKTFAGSDIDEIAVEFARRSKGQAMHQSIETVPGLRQIRKQTRNFRITGYIAGKQQIRTGGLGYLPDAFAQPLVLIGKRQFGAFPVHRAGDARGDGQLAGYTQNENSFSFEKSHDFI